MGRELTLSRARKLAEESRAVEVYRDEPYNEAPGLSRYSAYPSAPPDPWLVRRLPHIAAGAVLALVMTLSVLIALAIGSSSGTDQAVVRAEVAEANVSQLIGVVEKQVDATTKQVEAAARRDELLAERELREAAERKRREEEEAKRKKSEKSKTSAADIIGLILLVVILAVVSWSNYSKLWGLGIAAMLMILIVLLGSVPGVVDLVKMIMVPS